MAKGRKTGGRQKGTPNKLQSGLREAILEALEEAGGKDYLVQLAKREPEVFVRLLAKCLPQMVSGTDGGPVYIEVRKL